MLLAEQYRACLVTKEIRYNAKATHSLVVCMILGTLIPPESQNRNMFNSEVIKVYETEVLIYY